MSTLVYTASPHTDTNVLSLLSLQRSRIESFGRQLEQQALDRQQATLALLQAFGGMLSDLSQGSTDSLRITPPASVADEHALPASYYANTGTSPGELANTLRFPLSLTPRASLQQPQAARSAAQRVHPMSSVFGSPLRAVSNLSHSQLGQDLCILRLLMPFLHIAPRVLEVGAYDGDKMSNTRVFEALGWEVAHVEGDKHNFTQLCKNRPNCANVHALVSDAHKVQRVARAGTCTSICATSSEYARGKAAQAVELASKAEQEHSSETTLLAHAGSYETVTRTTQSVLQQLYGWDTLGSAQSARTTASTESAVQIGVAFIDVEGHEFEVLRGIDWAYTSIQVLCVEFSYDSEADTARSFKLDRYIQSLGFVPVQEFMFVRLAKYRASGTRNRDKLYVHRSVKSRY